MRILSAFCISLISLISMAQEPFPTNDDGKAEYRYGESIENLNADKLYDRGLAWVNKFYKSPNSVLKTQDKAGGKIVGRARFKLSQTDKKGNINPNAGFVSYQITLQFKDGKYRYIIDNIRWEQASYYDVTRWSDTNQSNYNAEKYNSFIAQTQKYFEELTANLEDYMKVGEVEKTDDW